MEPATQAWWLAAGRLLGTVVVGCGVGWLFGNLWGGLAAALAVHLTWVLVNLFRLEWWLRHRGYADPPNVGGVWGEIIAQIVRLHRRKRFHKQRFVQLMRQLQRSTAALPNGVVILNAQREIVWFNRMAARLLNLRRTGDLGLRIEHLLREPQFVRYLAGKDYSNPVVIRPTTGEDCYLSMQVAPYGDGQLLLLVSDVSRQMRLEAVRRDFVANASHELRSPLTVISGYLETLGQDAVLEADLQGPIAEMRRQAERMTAIIRDLLELSRLEESDAVSGGKPIDVAALLALLRQDVLARPEHPRDVRVRVDSAAQLIGDEPEIHSAFSNLVDNAAKYTPAEGSIEMRWRVDEDGGHFAVSDTGMGIPPEHIPRLTERFYRVDAGRSRATGGSGLGLAIVKHVLQRHGATLEVQSTLGAGSTFTCHFPVERIAPAARTPSAAIA
ncbi:MAG TPA: phosphate regulon sensor histidine kinase PhoR [Steroidobacteraceae bacterium]|jgi:two-component system phosphate regulon sensor histidine kinase PhoR|nr:phosphate regulon sensor histidine kinase PhoR [Steroidobacteraceae bacterium]